MLLAVFNMLPIPPLDGGRVIVGLLPPRLSDWFAGLERYGMIILIAVIFIIPMLTQINLFKTYLLPIVDSIIDIMLKGIGF